MVYFVARAPGIFHHLELKPTDGLLDLGCGQGLWSSALTTRVGWLVALDVQETHVRVAKHHLDQQMRANAYFVVASATALPFREQVFDKVLSVDVLDNISDDCLAAREIERTLKSGGRFVTTVLLKDRKHYLRPMVYPEHIRNYTVLSLSDLLASAGLELRSKFYFYHPLSTVIWEAANILRYLKITTVPVIGYAIDALLTVFIRLDTRLSRRPGAGMGLASIKPD